MSRTLASRADLKEKIISFLELTPGGDLRTGAIIGNDSALNIKALASPLMAEILFRHETLQ